MNRLSFLALLAFLFGALALAQDPLPGKIQIACVGASITAGFGTKDHAAQSYPAQMQPVLGEQYEVHNYGASGNTMLKQGDRPYWKSKNYAQALKLNPGIVVIDLGGNDSKAMNWAHKEDFAADSKAMVESFQGLPSKPRVLLLLPMPCFRPPSAGINDDIITKEQIPILTRVAYETKAQLVDMHTPFIDKKAWFDDGIHPNAEGAALMATIVAEAIKNPTASHFESGSDSHASYAPFDGEKTQWNEGFDRYDYIMDDATFEITPYKRPDSEGMGVGKPAPGKRRCIVVVPKTPAPGNPWSWRGCYWNHQPQTEIELLKRGFHVAFITPDPGPQWDAWYAFLTEKHGLSKKPAFIGMSKGGVNEYDWTTVNPDKVSCIYADNPAIRPASFARLDQLARNDIPLLNICGSEDFLLQRTSLPIENRYHELGGRITIMIKEGMPHHPHSLINAKPIADWIEKNTFPAKEDAPSIGALSLAKSYYYSLESSYLPLEPEKTYMICRGPGFVPCYTRYDVKTGSEWGVTSMTIVVPEKAAQGNPWVFRADGIQRDSVVDQALLAKGYHIVVAPLPGQPGAMLKQWNDAYQSLIDSGFAKKAVMEGTGAMGGEAYAWAIENPDKVACIYVENPILRSLMSKTQPLDNLAPLAKARIAVYHACGALDPLLESQTRAVEKSYKELGGEITVAVKEGEGHLPIAPRDPQPAVDFILAHSSPEEAAR